MKKLAVVYASRYGSSLKYAQWIAQRAGGQLIEASRLKKGDLSQYGAIVFGGGVYAGSLNGINRLIKFKEEICGKKLILFFVGITDTEDSGSYKKAAKESVPPAILENASLYYLRGALDYNKLSFLHKGVMRAMRGMLKKLPEEDTAGANNDFINIMERPVDYVRPESVEPIINELLGGGPA